MVLLVLFLLVYEYVGRVSAAAVCPKQVLPISPIITKPKYASLISVDTSKSNEGNTHEIEVLIDSSVLSPHIRSEIEATCFQLLILVDGFKRFEFNWPWPQSFVMSLRLGTHVIDVGLESRADIKWELCTPYHRSVFEIMPKVNSSIPSSSHLYSDMDPFINHRDDLSASEAFDCSSIPLNTYETHLIRVALVGPIGLSGQNILALEQARRLRNLCIRNSDGTLARFELAYFTNGKHGEFADLLNKNSVKLYHYQVIFNASLGENHTSALNYLVSNLLKASTFSDLPQVAASAVKELVDMFKNFHILSFMNHETMFLNDQVLVECARLAGIQKVLNEPSNLWWGNPPTIHGVHGLILPSSFAANFWKSNAVLSKDFHNLKYHIINPGIDFPFSRVLTREIIAATRMKRQDRQVVVVGWAGRVETQKAPGVFIRMAATLKALFQNHEEISVCFVMAGGGTLLGDHTASSNFNLSSTFIGHQGLGPLPSLAKFLQLDIGSCFSRLSQSNREKEISQSHAETDIEFLGPLEHEAMLSVIGEMDMIIHTNVLEETFCMVNTEAMARGVPVISFGVGGVSEYLIGEDRVDQHSRGLVVKPPTLAALVSQVAHLIENSELRYNMSVNAAEFVTMKRDMGNDRMAKQYAVLYHRLFCETNPQHCDTSPMIPKTTNEECGSFNWTDRLRHRTHIDQMALELGSSNPTSQVISLLDEVSDVVNCTHEERSVDAPLLINMAIDEATSFLEAKQYHRGLCRVTHLTFRRLDFDTVTSVASSHIKPKPLVSCRSRQLVALVSHTAAGIIRFLLDEEALIRKGTSSTFDQARYEDDQLKLLHKYMLQLWESTIALSPICRDAYILAARERLGTHGDQTPINWNIAAEWFRRAAVLKRPSQFSHKLLWTPPTPPDFVYVDLAVNGREVNLRFPTYSWNGFDEYEPTVKTGISVGESVWCLWSGNVWEEGKVSSNSPWFKGSVVEVSLDLMWYKIKLNKFDSTVTLDIPRHHVLSLTKLNTLGNSFELQQLEAILNKEAIILDQFCVEIAALLQHPTSVFIPQCLNQMVESLLIQRELVTEDYVSNAAPVMWLPGDAWRESDKLEKSPFAFTTTSKLRHDMEQFSHLAHLIWSCKEYNTEKDDISHRLLLSHHFSTLSHAYGHLLRSWEVMDTQPMKEFRDFHMISRNLTLSNGTSYDVPEQVREVIASANARVHMFGHAPAIESQDKSDVLVTESRWSLDENTKHFTRILNPPFDISAMSAEDILLRQGWAVIDNVFPLKVLKALESVCDETTSYFDLKKGYYGAYLSDGFADGLMFQIAFLFRERFPRTIGKKILSQLWAYKYDSHIAQGIRKHIDQGMYSVNCWLRSNDSIDQQFQGVQNETGGLRIYPGSQSIIASSKNFRKANRDFRFLESAIINMAEKRAEANNALFPHQAQKDEGNVHVIDIPHRENRCLLFTSDMVHETSPIRFKSGFTDRRLNFVLMFGLSRYLQEENEHST